MWRYAITIFLGAFLLFLVQPMIGKYILPWFGGGAGVWTVCMLFFQIALLAGYAYAHLIVVCFSPRVQMIIHLCLLGVALAFLPIIPDPALQPQPESNPVVSILVLLSATIGWPFVVVAATGPLLQAWFSRTHPGVSPYRLYALSNAGSLLGLLCYPFVIEHLMTRQAQAMLWAGGFLLFAIACGFSAVRQAWPGAPSDVSQQVAMGVAADDRRPSRFDRTMWLMLPAIAVVMLLAVTSQLSEEVAPAPFLWVFTLAVYLLTFIICFEKPSLYHRGAFTALALLSPWIVLTLLLYSYHGIRTQIAGYLLVLFICCMICHGELYRLRPTPRRLTAYYLCIAAGGALGGAFVALVAPTIFRWNYEFYIALYGAIAIVLMVMVRDPNSVFFRLRAPTPRTCWLGLIAIALLAGYLIRVEVWSLEHHLVVRTRNFYGTLSLKAIPTKVEGTHYVRLDHGRITHGAQQVNETRPDIRRIPTMYYGNATAAGILLQQPVKPRRVGAVGLGAGVIATFAQPGDSYRFYEINPTVIEFAEHAFTFLDDARHRNVQVSVVLGDARLMLAREQPQLFDVLILDAFSGDAIPIHLLTTEAFEIYNRHLVPNGVILVHISNRYLELLPIVHRLAEEFDFLAAMLETPADKDNLLEVAQWMIITRSESLLELPGIKDKAFRPPTHSPAPLWTDDHASLLDALR